MKKLFQVEKADVSGIIWDGKPIKHFQEEFRAEKQIASTNYYHLLVLSKLVSQYNSHHG